MEASEPAILTSWINVLFQPYVEATYRTYCIDIGQVEEPGQSMGSSRSTLPRAKNSLSRLNEVMQRRHETVQWICKQEENDEWTALVILDSILIGRGKGVRKQQAKLKAARDALCTPMLNNI